MNVLCNVGKCVCKVEKGAEVTLIILGLSEWIRQLIPHAYTRRKIRLIEVNSKCRHLNVVYLSEA